MKKFNNKISSKAVSGINAKKSVRVNIKFYNSTKKDLKWITSEYDITQKEVFDIILNDENIIKKSINNPSDFSDSDIKMKNTTIVISKGALVKLNKLSNSDNITKDIILNNAIILLKEDLKKTNNLNHEEALEIVEEFWIYSEKIEKDLTLALRKNDPILDRFGMIIIIISNLYSTIEAELKEGIEIDPDDFSQSGVENKNNKNSIISFIKTITNNEYKSKYLNLKSDDGEQYGKYFPKHKTKLLIVSNNNKYKASKKGKTQIWGGLKKWFEDENINIGDKIRIKYDMNKESINSRVPVYIDKI